MSVRRIFKSTFLWLNLLSVAVYVLSCHAASVNPNRSLVLAFIGLAYPVWLLLNAGWIIFWLVMKPYVTLVSFFTIALTFPYLNRYFTLNFSQKDLTEGSVTLMTYNVKTFDLYNWTQNVASRDSMFALIEKANPEVLCFQEFYTEDSGVFQNVHLLTQRYPYFYFEKTLSLRDKDHWGIATFSKHPIVGKGQLRFDNSKHNLCIYTDIEKGKRVFRIYNVHLQSIHLGTQDYAYLQQLPSQEKENLPGMKSIVSKLKLGFERRGAQTDQLARFIRNNQIPFILCGDFNDMPNSYAYHTLADGLQDAFIVAGNGLGKTFSGPIPMARIDFVLADAHFDIQRYRVFEKNFSDHYPVLCSFGFRE